MTLASTYTDRPPVCDAIIQCNADVLTLIQPKKIMVSASAFFSHITKKMGDSEIECMLFQSFICFGINEPCSFKNSDFLCRVWPFTVLNLIFTITLRKGAE